MVDQTSICEKFMPMLDAFYDGELSKEDNLTVSAHIKDCQNCRNHLHEVERIVASLKGLPRLQMPHELTVNWQSLIQTSTKPWWYLKLKQEKSSLLALAAAVILLVLAGSFLRLRSFSQFFSIADSQKQAAQEVVARKGDLGVGESNQVRRVVDQQVAQGKRAGVSYPNQQTGDGELLALYQNESKLASEELGIATNEDGLYALKL